MRFALYALGVFVLVRAVAGTGSAATGAGGGQGSRDPGTGASSSSSGAVREPMTLVTSTGGLMLTARGRAAVTPIGSGGGVGSLDGRVPERMR